MASLVKMASNVISQIFTSDRCKMALEAFYNGVTRLSHILLPTYFALNAVNQISAPTGDVFFTCVSASCLGTSDPATLLSNGQ